MPLSTAGPARGEHRAGLAPWLIHPHHQRLGSASPNGWKRQAPIMLYMSGSLQQPSHLPEAPRSPPAAQHIQGHPATEPTTAKARALPPQPQACSRLLRGAAPTCQGSHAPQNRADFSAHLSTTEVYPAAWLSHHHPRRRRNTSRSGRRETPVPPARGCPRTLPGGRQGGDRVGPDKEPGVAPTRLCPLPEPKETPSEAGPRGSIRYLNGGSARLAAAARRHHHLRRGGRLRGRRRRRGGRPSIGTRHSLTAKPRTRRRRRCLVPPASHGELGPAPAAARTTANMAARPVRPLPGGRGAEGRPGQGKPPPPSCERAGLRAERRLPARRRWWRRGDPRSPAAHAAPAPSAEQAAVQPGCVRGPGQHRHTAAWCRGTANTDVLAGAM